MQDLDIQLLDREHEIMIEIFDTLRERGSIHKTNDEIGILLQALDPEIQKLYYESIWIIARLERTCSIFDKQNQALRNSLQIMAETNNGN